jgi:L-alanine-DL-glutamate epimerase-like enolase superfamily enzyme
MENLANHRLAAIRTLRVSSRYPRVVGKNARLGIHGTGPTSQVRVLTTDQGAQGWGLSSGSDEALLPLLGRPLSELFDPQVGVIAPSALPLDVPLHDLAGVIRGQSVAQMLGAQGSRRVSCYDGAIYMDDILPEEQPRGLPVVLENCRHDYALGYRDFKLKIGRGFQWMPPEEGLRRDIAVTRAVREAFPQGRILVDANNGYTCASFLHYLDAVVDCDLYWIEEPFHENRADLLRLREFLAQRSPRTLIADGEANYDLALMEQLAREKLVDVLIMDIIGLGFTPWRRWCKIAAEAGVMASPHTWGEPLKTRYAAMLGAGLGQVLTVEGIPATTADVDWSAYPLVEGVLSVPDAPGFGLRLLR